MTPVHPSTGCSYLCKAPVHEQFRACDVAAVVGCEKHNGPRNFFRLSEPAERNRGGDHLGALLSGFRRTQEFIQARRIDRSGTHDVHTNVSLFQIRRPGPGKRSDRSLRRTVHAVCRQPFAADDGRVQDDRPTFRHQRKRFLNREENAVLATCAMSFPLLARMSQTYRLTLLPACTGLAIARIRSFQTGRKKLICKSRLVKLYSSLLLALKILGGHRPPLQLGTRTVGALREAQAR